MTRQRKDGQITSALNYAQTTRNAITAYPTPQRTVITGESYLSNQGVEISSTLFCIRNQCHAVKQTKGNIMLYFALALSIVVATATVCVSYLIKEAGILYVVGLAFSAFAFGFLLGEQTEGDE
jgi:hypothetical protein